MRSVNQTIVTSRVNVIRQNRVADVGTTGCDASARYLRAAASKPEPRKHEPKSSSHFSSSGLMSSDLATSRLDSMWSRLPGRLSSWR